MMMTWIWMRIGALQPRMWVMKRKMMITWSEPVKAHELSSHRLGFVEAQGVLRG